jgi:hypothetical protein
MPDHIQYARRVATIHQNAQAGAAILIDELQLVSRQRARFEQQPIRRADLADIVQQRRHLQLVALLRIEPVGQPPRGTTKRHPQRMRSGRSVLVTNRREQAAGNAQSHFDQVVLTSGERRTRRVARRSRGLQQLS